MNDCSSWGAWRLITLVFSITATAHGQAVPTEDVLFHASFDGTIRAERADGSPEATVSDGEVAYTEGVAGQALLADEASLAYATAGNLELDAGTVSMWVKPVNWDGQSDRFVFFFDANVPDQASLRLYKYFKPKLGVLFLAGRPVRVDDRNQWVYASSPSHDWAQGQWHLLTATWSRRNQIIKLYVNGKPSGARRIESAIYPPELPEMFTINRWRGSHIDRGDRTAIDDLIILRRALSSAEVQLLYQSYQREAKLAAEQVEPSSLAVPYISQPPLIDGQVGNEEWRGTGGTVGASRIGTPKLPLDKLSRVRVAYDDQALYLLHVSPLPRDRKLRVSATEPDDSSIAKDDAVEVLLAPDRSADELYQMVVNSNGMRYDNHGGDAAWDADWTVAQSLYEGRWIVEMRIPFASLDVPAPQAGDRWGANFCRDWAEADSTLFTSWSFTPGSYFKPLGELVFVDDRPVARLTVDPAALRQRQLRGAVEIIRSASGSVQNSSEEPLALRITGTSAAGHTVFEEVHELSLAPGATQRHKIDHPLDGVLATAVRVQLTGDTRRPLFDHTLPLVYPSGLTVLPRPNMDRQMLEVDVSFAGLFGDAAGLHGTVRLLGATNEAVAETPLVIKSGRPRGRATFDLQGVPAGDYQLEVLIYDDRDELLERQIEQFEHLGTPEWLNSKAGVSDEVLPPWTPLAVQGQAVRAWGRSYAFEQTSPLPTRMVSQDVEVLRSPALLTLRAGGEAVQWDAAPTVTRSSGATVELQTNGYAGDLQAQARMQMEFDGLLLVRLTLTPPADGSTQLDRLSLALPLDEAVSDLIYAHDYGGDPIHGALGEVELNRFMPYVWVGNSEVGLSWFIQSREHWNIADLSRAMRLEPQSGEAADGQTLTITMVDQPTILTEPITLMFGLQATPVKPVDPHRQRRIRIQPGREMNLGHPWSIDHAVKRYAEEDPRWGFLSPQITGFETLTRELEQWRERGINMPIYLAPDIVSPQSAEYRLFRDLWRNPHGAYPFACAGSSFTDFTASLVQQMVNKSDLRSVYVDCAQPYACGNLAHGCGYVRPDDSVGLTYPVLALRAYFKRLYAILHAQDGEADPSVLWVHASAGLVAPVHAFTDIVVQGEELQHRIAKNPNYFAHYPLDVFRAMYGKQFGIPQCLLPNLGRVGAAEQRQAVANNATFMTLVLLHDTMLWNLWTNKGWVNGVYKQLDAFGIRESDVRFLPYWKQEAVTVASASKQEASDIVISLYRRPGRTLAVIGNAGETDQTVSLNIDPAALNLPQQELALRELMEGRTLDAKAPQVTVPHENFRLLLIEGP